MNLEVVNWDQLLYAVERELIDRRSSEAAGADDAWRELRRILRQYAIKILARDQFLRDDIDDVTQLVLLKLQSVDTIRMLRGRTSPTGYLLVMIRNAATDLVRSRARERSAKRRIALERPAKTPASRGWLATQAHLSVALAALSERERELLRLRFWENMSIGELAARDGCTYSAMAVRLFRLIKRLEGALPTLGDRP